MRFLYMSPPRDKTACQTSPCKCKICISSIESVYNKKKIQMFVVNMTFISSREVKKCIFHSCLRHSWNIHFFHFTRWNKSHIHSKHLNILYICHPPQFKGLHRRPFFRKTRTSKLFFRSHTNRFGLEQTKQYYFRLMYSGYVNIIWPLMTQYFV